MNERIDIHHHILYGIDDDGPQTKAEMQAMLKMAAEDGTTTIVATPHVMPGLYFFDQPLYEERIAEAQEFSQSENLDIKILPGAELLYTPQTCDMLRGKKVPTMAGTRNVLIEFITDTPYHEIDRAVGDLVQAGFTPILAHVERYDCFLKSWKKMAQLKEERLVEFQVNSGSIIRAKGFFFKRFIRSIFENDLVDYVASDAHNVSTRKTQLSAAFEKLEADFPAFRQAELV